jgi:hypothetical protein
MKATGVLMTTYHHLKHLKTEDGMICFYALEFAIRQPRKDGVATVLSGVNVPFLSSHGDKRCYRTVGGHNMLGEAPRSSLTHRCHRNTQEEQDEVDAQAL